MEEKIKHTVSLLKAAYTALWLIPVLCIVLGETDILPVGGLVENLSGSYFFEAACILITAICVPLSLKLFSLVLTRKIDAYTISVALDRYAFWSLVRLIMLELAVLVNLAGYYFTLSSTGALCACIVLTASFFCLPGEKKLREELHIEKEEAAE